VDKGNEWIMVWSHIISVQSVHHSACALTVHLSVVYLFAVELRRWNARVDVMLPMFRSVKEAVE